MACSTGRTVVCGVAVGGDCGRNRTAWTQEPASRRGLIGFGDDGTGAVFCVAADGSVGVFVWNPIDGRGAAASRHRWWPLGRLVERFDHDMIAQVDAASADGGSPTGRSRRAGSAVPYLALALPVWRDDSSPLTVVCGGQQPEGIDPGSGLPLWLSVRFVVGCCGRQCRSLDLLGNTSPERLRRHRPVAAVWPAASGVDQVGQDRDDVLRALAAYGRNSMAPRGDPGSGEDDRRRGTRVVRHHN